MTIDRLLLQHAEHTPDAIAIVTLDGRYTYRDLEGAAESYRNALEARGVGNGDRVVAVLEPGPAAVALLCACSRLGAIWVPAGPDTPATRIQAVVESVGPVALLSAAETEPLALDASALSGVALGTIQGGAVTWSTSRARVPRPSRRRREVLPIDAAYVIFTSGSTGKPKGIVMTHRAACAFFDALIAFNGLGAGAVVGSIAPIQFDFWLLDTALALGSGSAIAFVPRSSFYQPRRMARQMRSLEITQMNGVPSIWASMLQHAEEELRRVDRLGSILFAGEAFPLADLRQLQALFPALRVINCFGQSESIACSFFDVPNPLPAATTRLAIGHGHPGVEMLNIAEGDRQILEPHVVGELYLRAPTLFSGYWADEEATRKALVPNPLLPSTAERVFKTGDLVVRDEAGDYYFVGRTDEQIKILGNRVELGDITATLRLMPGVADAIVVSVSDPSGTAPVTVACVVSVADACLTGEGIRSWCLKNLPRHMLPTHIQIEDALPLNENGKVDGRRIKREWSSRLWPSATAHEAAPSRHAERLGK